MNQTIALPDISGNGGVIDLDTKSALVEFDVALVDTLYLRLGTIGFAGASWPTGTVPVLTLTLSVDGVTFDAPPSGATTYNSAGAKSGVSVRGYTRARLAVTTAGSSSLTHCTVAANGSRLGS